MEQTYEEVRNLLKKVNFGEIWPGFHLCPFALYDENRACIEGKITLKPDFFRGNTTVEYEGEHIAIWKLEGNRPGEDLEILASDMVHEMFHAFQMEQGEGRFPDDLTALYYPDDIENFVYKFRENQILAQALRERDERKKRELLAQFCRLRRHRSKSNEKFAAYECMAETVEGMAEYAGSRALEMLAPQKYGHRMETYLGFLEKLSPLLLDVRRISYYVGTVLALAANAGKLSIAHDIGKEERSLYKVLCDSLDGGQDGEVRVHTDETEVYTPAAEVWEAAKVRADGAEVWEAAKVRADGAGMWETAAEEIRVLLQGRAEAHRQREEHFFAAARRKVEGDFRICGYDPMNMIRLGERILGTHFFQLMDRHTGEIITLEGEILLETVRGETGEVCAYWS